MASTWERQGRGRDRLRARGLRATRPRLEVYTLLSELDGHFSVDELRARLEDRGIEVSRMSLYNVVSDLSAAGLIVCAPTGPGRALYEANETWHHHFVCRSCGRVLDVPCVLGRKPCLEPPEGLEATVEEAQVTFRGLCGECSSDPDLESVRDRS